MIFGFHFDLSRLLQSCSYHKDYQSSLKIVDDELKLSFRRYVQEVFPVAVFLGYVDLARLIFRYLISLQHRPPLSHILTSRLRCNRGSSPIDIFLPFLQLLGKKSLNGAATRTTIQLNYVSVTCGSLFSEASHNIRETEKLSL